MPTLIEVQVDQTIIIALLVFSAMITAVLLMYLLSQARAGEAIYLFVAAQIFIIIMTVGYIFELLAPTVEIKWFIITINYIPLSFIGFVFMQFAYTHLHGKMMDRTCLFLSLIPPAFAYFGVLTDPLHHQAYTSFTLEGAVFGPINYFIVIMAFVYLSIGAFFFVSGMHTVTFLRKRQAIYFIIAVVLPAAINVLDVFGLYNFGFAVMHLVSPVSMILFIVLVIKYQFLDVLPNAVNDAIESMNEGVVVINNNNEIIDFNKHFFRHVFNMVSVSEVKTIDEFIEKIGAFIDEKELEVLRKEISIKENELNGILNVKGARLYEHIIYYTVKPLFDYSKHKNATLITFYDITDTYQMSNELRIKNEELLKANEELKEHTETVHQLTMETERNAIMLEIHDTIGHSMMELLTLLEMLDLKLNRGSYNTDRTIKEALEKGRVTLAEVRESVARYKKMGGMQ